jgi:hypothetical protein
MLTLNDVHKIVIDPVCLSGMPCRGHESKVTLKNGRSVSNELSDSSSDL